MRKSEVFPSKYLKADCLSQGNGKYGTIVLTIAGVATSEPFDDGKVQRVLSFKEDGRELGLNATNWDTIAYITGKDDDEEWTGAKIELFVDPMVRFAGKLVPAIRVRAPQGVTPVGNQFTAQVHPSAMAQSNGTKPEPITTKAQAWASWKRQGATGSDADKADFRRAMDLEIANSRTKEENFTADNWARIGEKRVVTIDEDDIPF